MFQLIHALIGSWIGEEFHSVILIILLSFISHFIFDSIPHWDSGFNKNDKKRFLVCETFRVRKSHLIMFAIDFLATILVISFLYHDLHNKLIFLGAFAAVLPDFIKLGYGTKLKKNKYFMKHVKFHAKIQNDVGWKLGVITQITIIIILLIILL
ncbi:MAG: hypothetical protein Q7R52_03885 [archaeon]|nr:hypothetical protein [archaeon]